MPLYGHELGEEINALASGLDFAIAIDKDKDERGEAYVGMDALKRTRDNAGPKTKLVGMWVEGKRSARQGMTVKEGARQVGTVTSACIGPTVGRGIAMAYVEPALAHPGQKLQIDTGRDALLDAEVTTLPFYKAPKKT